MLIFVYRCRNKVHTMKPRILEHHCHEASKILSETLILLQTNKPQPIVIVSPVFILFRIKSLNNLFFFN